MKLAAMVDYLAERWDEEEADLDRILNMRYVHGYVRVHGERMATEITAKRKVLAECETGIVRAGDVAELARTILNLLVEPYADRSDFPGRRTAETAPIKQR